MTDCVRDLCLVEEVEEALAYPREGDYGWGILWLRGGKRLGEFFVGWLGRGKGIFRMGKERERGGCK